MIFVSAIKRMKPALFSGSMFLSMIVLLICLTACTPRPKFVPGGEIQTGIASWYGPNFHGKSTSNKEIYDMYDMTAAHQTLPFGTYVMVTNLSNNRSVIVRINDRGPFVGDRILDLSYAAARLLDMVGPGTAPVRLEILKNLSSASTRSGFSVQVGAFSSKENADTLKSRLELKYGRVEVAPFKTPNQVYYRVRIKVADHEAAMRAAQLLSEEGYSILIIEEF